MKVSVITFPGSNCDHDAMETFTNRGHKVKQVWHKDTELGNPDLIILPGGFSYGDYLRCGSIAKFSPVMPYVIKHAEKGRLVFGICNGFQILTECGLLPGTLMMNRDLQFICQHQYIRVETCKSPYTGTIPKGKVLDIPIAHKEGNYYIDNVGLEELKINEQIIFRYCDQAGNVTDAANPNGTIENIAGICSKQRNVLGMMPHPERAASDVVASQDGIFIIKALEEFFG